jgi:hypothetical protein
MKSHSESTNQQNQNLPQIPGIRFVLACNFSFILGIFLFVVIVIILKFYDANYFFGNVFETHLYYDPENPLPYIIKRLPEILLNSAVIFIITFGTGWLFAKFFSKNWRGINWRKNVSYFFATSILLIIICIFAVALTNEFILKPDLILYTIFNSFAPIIIIFNNTVYGDNLWNKLRKKPINT